MNAVERDYHEEINDKTSPDKRLKIQVGMENDLSDKRVHDR